MGKIIRNGINYSGAADAATAVNYDGSVSGLKAQTVQEAVDEVNNSLKLEPITYTFINKDVYDWVTYANETIKTNGLAFINFRLQSGVLKNYTKNTLYDVLQLSEKPAQMRYCVANNINIINTETVSVYINADGVLSIAFNKDMTNYAPALDIFGFFKCI